MPVFKCRSGDRKRGAEPPPLFPPHSFLPVMTTSCVQFTGQMAISNCLPPPHTHFFSACYPSAIAACFVAIFLTCTVCSRVHNIILVYCAHQRRYRRSSVHVVRLISYFEYQLLGFKILHYKFQTESENGILI